MELNLNFGTYDFIVFLISNIVSVYSVQFENITKFFNPERVAFVRDKVHRGNRSSCIYIYIYIRMINIHGVSGNDLRLFREHINGR